MLFSQSRQLSAHRPHSSRRRQRFSALIALNMALLTFSSVGAAVLPDFEQLVEQYSPTVVNIQTRGLQKTADLNPNQQVPEFLQRFFQFQGPSQGQGYGQGHPEQRRFPNQQGQRGHSPAPVPQQKADSMGSGVIVSADGYILTNAHVVAGAEEITVRLDNRNEFPATLVGSDNHSDIAVLKIEKNNLPFAKFGNSDQVKVGQWVLAIGAPFGLEQTATQGIVSAVSRSLPNDTYVPFIQTDVALNPGNSGGPLFNLDGEVIGINSQIFSRTGGYMGLSFAIPINLANSIAERLKTDGKVHRGWLGVGIQELDSDLAHSFKLPQPTGALVRQVEANSPAAQAKLKAGDVILSFGGTEISRSTDLPPLVANSKIGQPVALKILRNGNELEIDITIGTLAAPGQPVAALSPAAPGPLGITVADLNEAERQTQGSNVGVKVAEVLAGKPGANAGLTANDIILSFNHQAITSAAKLAELAKASKPGSVVPMLIQRNSHTQYFAVEFPPA